MWENLNALFGLISFTKQTLILMTCIRNKINLLPKKKPKKQTNKQKNQKVNYWHNVNVGWTSHCMDYSTIHLKYVN